jgi:hypothetical protein
MKVFISSLITNFTQERQAARRAVSTLRHDPVMAEDFGAQPNSPQIACLQGLRSSDAMILILGEHYGFVPDGSPLSATHQEYREARDTKPVLAFVQEGITPAPEQAEFIREVQAWEGGLFRGGYRGIDDLQGGIIRALHDFTLAGAVGPVDENDLITRAAELIPLDERTHSTATFVDVAIAGGPKQRLLRPAEMETPELVEYLQQAAMFGEHRVFDRTKGSESSIVKGDLWVMQERGASVRLTESCSLALRLPLVEESSRGGFNPADGMLVILEEDVQRRLSTALGFAAQVLEQVDATQRLSHLGVAARIAGAEYRAWRTQAQHTSNPRSVQIGMSSESGREPVTLSVRRAALRLDPANLIGDVLVPLRRMFPRG